jgi:hypothetical protein
MAIRPIPPPPDDDAVLVSICIPSLKVIALPELMVVACFARLRRVRNHH